MDKDKIKILVIKKEKTKEFLKLLEENKGKNKEFFEKCKNISKIIHK